MKIIVSHVYSNDNKGDAALLSVLLGDIRRVFEAPEITILTLDKIEKDESFEKVPVKNGFMYYVSDRYKNPLLQSLYASFVAFSTFLWALVYRCTGLSIPLPNNLKNVVDLYRDADLIIPVGGGYIRSKTGIRDAVLLFFTLHPLIFSYIAGKPTVNYTQSVGPFGSTFHEKMARFTVKRLSGIIVRENISLQLLKRWGITKNVLLSVDSGFSFISNATKNLRKELEIPGSQMMVGVTVRSWLKPEGQATYEKTIAMLCDYIIEKYNAAIVFIPQVTVNLRLDDDRESGQRVYGYMEHKKNVHLINERYEYQTIKAVYGQLDYLVGTRFHSVIFALTSLVPSVAVEYEYKTRGIMNDLGLGKWVVDIRSIEIRELINLFDQLVAEKDSYKNHLKKVLPAYIAQAQISIEFVKEIYQKTKS